MLRESEMNHRTSYRLLLLIVLLLGFAWQVSAQEATIVGTVTDPTGASVPGATIAITNKDTGVVRQFESTATGEYVAPGLFIGHYSVRTEAKGFKPVEHKEVVLQ